MSLDSIDDYRRLIVDDLALVTAEYWGRELDGFAGANPGKGHLDFIDHLRSHCKLTIRGVSCDALSPYQLGRIEKPGDRGDSLKLNGGKYVIVDLLAAGGQGSVFLARRREPGQPGEQLVALKFGSPMSTTIMGVDRFERECHCLCDTTRRGEQHSE